MNAWHLHISHTNTPPTTVIHVLALAFAFLNAVTSSTSLRFLLNWIKMPLTIPNSRLPLHHLPPPSPPSSPPHQPPPPPSSPRGSTSPPTEPTAPRSGTIFRALSPPSDDSSTPRVSSAAPVHSHPTHLSLNLQPIPCTGPTSNHLFTNNSPLSPDNTNPPISPAHSHILPNSTLQNLMVPNSTNTSPPSPTLTNPPRSPTHSQILTNSLTNPPTSPNPPGPSIFPNNTSPIPPFSLHPLRPMTPGPTHHTSLLHLLPSAPPSSQAPLPGPHPLSRASGSPPHSAPSSATLPRSFFPSVNFYRRRLSAATAARRRPSLHQPRPLSDPSLTQSPTLPTATVLLQPSAAQPVAPVAIPVPAAASTTVLFGHPVLPPHYQATVKYVEAVLNAVARSSPAVPSHPRSPRPLLLSEGGPRLPKRRQPDSPDYTPRSPSASASSSVPSPPNEAFDMECSRRA